MVSNFDVLKQMSAQNKDIRLFPSVLSARMNGDKSKVEIGVNTQTAFDAMADGKVGIALLVWDVKQFAAIRAELEAAQGRPDLDLDIDDGC